MTKDSGGFLKHFMIIGVGTFINMIITLITTPMITRIVDPAEYGQLAIFNMYTSIAVMVLCAGLDQALVRFFYNHDDIEYKRGLLKTCILLPLMFYIGAAAVLMVLMKLNIVEFEFSSKIIVILLVNIIVNIWNRISILVLRITYQSKKYSLSSILQKGSFAFLVLVLILIFKSNYFLILTLSTVLSFLIPTLYAVFSTKEYWKFRGIERVDNFREVITYGLPFILSMGLTTLFQAIDRITLNYFCTYSEVGIYSSAMNLIGVFAIIQSTFNALWGPLQVEHYVKNPEDKNFFHRGNQYITIIMFFMGFSVILVKDLFVYLLGSKYRAAAYIMPFLIFNPIMYTISETTCAGIGVSKKSYLNIIVSLGACISNICGNLLLVPIYGAKGAAISTGISYIVFWALRTIMSNKYFYVNYRLDKISVVIVMALLYAWYSTFFEFGYLSIAFYAVSMVVMYILYKDEIKEGIQYGIMQLKQLKYKKAE